jgi:hypothetical protein
LMIDEEAQAARLDFRRGNAMVLDLDDDGDADITITRDQEIITFENVDGTYVVNHEMELPTMYCMVDMDLNGEDDIIGLDDGITIKRSFDGVYEDYVVDDVNTWFGACSIDDLDNDLDEDIVVHTFDEVIIYTNLLVNSQRVNVTDHVNYILRGETGEDLFLDLEFPDGREILEIYDISIKYEKIDKDDDENRLDPEEVDNGHGGAGDGEITDPEGSEDEPEEGGIETHDPPGDEGGEGEGGGGIGGGEPENVPPIG